MNICQTYDTFKIVNLSTFASIKLKLTVCTLTPFSSFHFESNVLEDKASTLLMQRIIEKSGIRFD